MRFDSKDQVRRDVDSRVERLDALGDHLDQRAADHERINELRSELKDGGTAEALQAVQDSVGEAKREIRTQFEAEHAELETEQSEAKRLEQDVEGEARTDQDNAREIAETRSDLNTEEAAEPLDQAAAELQEDAEVLDAEAERLRERREMSLEEAQRLARRVMEGG